MQLHAYLHGVYLIDPFILARIRDTPASIWRLKAIAPERACQGEYLLSFFAQTGLAEEVGSLSAVDAERSGLSSRRSCGHSSEAIGRISTISPGTIRFHRRKVYSTLRSSSQGEFFSILLKPIGAG